MAQRRMFSLKVVDTDMFLEMPISSRLLYYDLSMRADDDGFVESPKKILKMIGCSEDDYRILCHKQYLIPFETGVCVIKHWHIHNLIRSDRYTETQCKEEKEKLSNLHGKYERENVIPIDNQLATQDRIGKDRIGKDRIGEDIEETSIEVQPEQKRSKFIHPSFEEVQKYLIEIQILNHYEQASRFMDYYLSNGWRIGGKTPMKDWKAACRNWKRNCDKFSSGKQYQKKGFDPHDSEQQEILQRIIRGE